MEKENAYQEPEGEGKLPAGQENSAGPAENAEAERQDFGKFKSLDALRRAYLQLEAEFTRKSQRLKALEEREKEKEKEESTPVSPRTLCDTGEQTPPSGESGEVSSLPDAESESEPAEGKEERLYREASASERVRTRILSDFFAARKGVPLLAGAGSGVTAPVHRPASFAEAGNLALGYLKSQQK